MSEYLTQTKETFSRPRAWENVYQWHLAQESDTEPCKKSAVFVVHGMGRQRWAETSAALRAGVENVMDSPKIIYKADKILPAPFIQDGFWADYDNLSESFKEEIPRFEPTQLAFFELLWKSRSISAIRTFGWFLGQLARLVFDPRVIIRVRFRWIIYLLLLIVTPPLFLFMYIFFPSIMSNVLNDVRIYCSPRGIVERAIVQKIDCRVGEAFLKCLGLDWNFRKLDDENKIIIDHKPVQFDKVFWVAHSLGTVISYNVISDLFCRADDLAVSGDEQQKDGVKIFWESFQRFITLGSPLDKIAFLFGRKVLRPWPERMFKPEKPENGEMNKKLSHFKDNWWINYYHVLDPVSGALSSPLICPVKQKPNNYHLRRIFYLPGLAHTVYWKDTFVLSYLLSRYYGIDSIEFKREDAWPPWLLTLIAVLGYIVWVSVVFSPVILLLFLLNIL